MRLPPLRRYRIILCATRVSCRWVSMCENFTSRHKHRQAANVSPLVGPGLQCRVAVGVPGCDPGISLFVLCHSPSLWGDDSSAVPEGMKPEIGRA